MAVAAKRLPSLFILLMIAQILTDMADIFLAMESNRKEYFCSQLDLEPEFPKTCYEIALNLKHPGGYTLHSVCLSKGNK
jgi:hypothetical protein